MACLKLEPVFSSFELFSMLKDGEDLFLLVLSPQFTPDSRFKRDVIFVTSYSPTPPVHADLGEDIGERLENDINKKHKDAGRSFTRSSRTICRVTNVSYAKIRPILELSRRALQWMEGNGSSSLPKLSWGWWVWHQIEDHRQTEKFDRKIDTGKKNRKRSFFLGEINLL